MERTYEIRGHGKKWKVFYPAEDNLTTPVPWFDKEGKLKEVVYAAGPTGKMTECHFEGRYDEAVEYARWLNPEAVIKKVTVKPRATAAQNGHHEPENKTPEQVEVNPFLAHAEKQERSENGSKVNLCRACEKEIEPTGRRGRPPVYHDECRP